MLGLDDVHLPSLEVLGEEDWLQALDLSQPRGLALPPRPAYCAPAPSAALPVPGAGGTSSLPVPIARPARRAEEYSSLESAQTILGSTPRVEPLLGSVGGAESGLLASSLMAGGGYGGGGGASSYFRRAAAQAQPQQQMSLVDLDELLGRQVSQYIPDDEDYAAPPPPRQHHLSFYAQPPPEQARGTAPAAWGAGLPHGRTSVWQPTPQQQYAPAPAHYQQQHPGYPSYGGSYGQPQQQLFSEYDYKYAAAGPPQFHSADSPYLQPPYQMAAYEEQPLRFDRRQDFQYQHQQAEAHRAQAYHHHLHQLQQQQQQQRHQLLLARGQGAGCEEEEEEVPEGAYEEPETMDSEHATEDSDATMHAMNSPGGTVSPVSPPHSMDTAAARPAAPLRRVSSLRSAGTAGRSPQVRLRMVMKQATGARAGRPSAATAAAAAAAGGSGRPRRAAALRSLAGSGFVADVYGEDDEEYDLGSEEVGYESGGEELSPVSSGRVAAAAPAAAPMAGNKKKHNPWSQEETEALIEGVRLVGVGKWAEIKKLPLPSVAGLLLARSAVDLKDKWRNLSRVARLPKSALKSRLAKGGSDTPLELVLAVKELLDSSREHREWR